MSKLFVGGSASLFLIIIGVFIFLQFVPVGLWSASAFSIWWGCGCAGCRRIKSYFL